MTLNHDRRATDEHLVFNCDAAARLLREEPSDGAPSLIFSDTPLLKGMPPAGGMLAVANCLAVRCVRFQPRKVGHSIRL